MYETLRRDELMWRPWLVKALPVQRLDVLREAHAQGCGVILSFAHHGQYSGVFPSIARHGLKLHVAIAEWLHTQNTPTYNGRFWRQHVKVVGSHGVGVIPAVSGASAVMGRMLAAGAIVAIASDVAGNTATTFMGRSVKTASGAARLALSSGAPIIPVTVHRGGRVQILRIEDALQVDPAMDVSTVLAAILRAQESAVGEWPEAYHWPAKRFGLVRPEDVERFGFPPDGYYQRYRV
ncbi:lysophospholipid acyltransferase family protein [uncultured Jatrophihabitans sp.]|uniref:lysophospholipid acyltransferase family protein n=1 Tax=uncultured Jatrophihabitans sp. TaxID=1610747 RepID=UPI0035CAF98F